VGEAKGDFRDLLRRLDSDPAVASETYLILRQKLILFFQHNNCPPAEDHADEALSRIARRSELDSVENIGAFAYGVARMMILEIREKQKKATPLDDWMETGAAERNPEARIVAGIDRQRKMNCFLRCLKELPDEERLTFITFELADPETRVADRIKLATRRGMTAGALRVNVFRIRTKLTRNVLKCLKIKRHAIG
jgi:DNA-directed RNA polymerase specialized sigma24 family protein